MQKAVPLFLLVAALIAGAAVRALYLGELRGAPDLVHPGLDAGYHAWWARAIATDDWSPPPDQADPAFARHPYFRPPGYPWLLGALHVVTGGHPLALRGAQMLLGLASVAFGWLVVRRWWGVLPAAVTAWLSATYWVMVYYEGELLEPVWLVACTWALLFVLGLWRERPRQRLAASAGLLLGLLGMLRPNLLLVAPVVAGWMLVSRRADGASWAAGLRAAALAALAAALCVLPATARNWIVSRDLVLVSANGGINLLMGQDTEAIADHASGETGHWNCFDFPALLARASAEAGRPLRASEVSAQQRREAWRIIRAEPGATLRRLLLKTLLFWGPREVSNNKVEELERAHSRVLRALPVPFAWLAGWGVLGLLLARGAASPGSVSRALAALMVLYALACFASVLPFIAAGQYRVPVLPILMAGCGIALGRAVELARGGRRGAALAVVAGGLALSGVFSVNAAGYQVQPARWHLARAVAYERGGDVAAAEAAYRATMALAPDLELGPLRLAVLLAKQDRVAEALPLFEQALAMKPGDPAIRFNLGLSLAVLGRPAEAVPHFEAVVAADPGHADAHQNLAEALQQTGDPDRAAEHRRLAALLRRNALPGASPHRR